MCGSSRRIEDIVSNIVGVECYNIIVHGRSFGVVAKTNVTEFSATHHAWGDVCHTNRSSSKVMTCCLCEPTHSILRSVVSRSIDISVVSCNTAHINDMSTTTLLHTRKKCSAHSNSPQHVGIHHGLCCFHIILIRRSNAQCKACVVNNDFNIFELCRKLIWKLSNSLQVTYRHAHRVNIYVGIIGENIFLHTLKSIVSSTNKN
mmetsp:Transcript_85655/g.167586  ORF Transcript_85655/g.167586 Transcript_85655/m.167586 type:complete len:203 (+) Transcript_85655:179-787(+)